MWRYIWLCPAYLLSTSIPLLSTIGRNFEYEYVLIASILSLLIIPTIALFTPNYLIPSKDKVYTPFVKFDYVWILVIAPIVALLPAVFGFTVAQCPCSKSGFIFWMFVQWYPIWIFSHVIYHAVFKFRLKGFSRTRISMSILSIYILLSLILACTLWFNPQKRTISLISGFLHGPVYDNWIPVDHGIFMAQMSHVLLALALLSAVLLKWQSKITKVVVSIFFVGWFSLSISSTFFDSVGSGKSRLNKLLSNVLEDKDFALRYSNKDARELSSGLMRPRKYITAIYNEAKFHVQELKGILGEESLPFVHIYVYPDTESKKLWFGGGATDVADVYTPSIHIRADKTFVHRTLRHELVHALASDFAYHGLGAHPNMAFTEGLAVALAPEESSVSLDEGVASLIARKKLPRLSNLFSPMFWKEAGPRAYIVAGSIISYINDKYGFDKVKELYRGKAINKVFGEDKPFKAVLKEWREHVLSTNVQAQDDLASEALLRSSGLFKELCPHTRADYAKSRSDSIYVRVRQPFSVWNAETMYWDWRMSLDPTDRSAVLRSLYQRAKDTVNERIIDKTKVELLVSEVRNARQDPIKNIEDVELAILESDLHSINQDRKQSINILTYLRDESKRFRFGSVVLRKIESRLKIETTLDVKEVLVWRRYLAGWSDTIPEKAKGMEPWILTYLRLLNGDRKLFDAEFLAFLLNNIPPPSTELPVTFSVMWYKYLGLRLLDRGSYQDAEMAFLKASEIEKSSNSKDLFKEYSRLAKFYQSVQN